MNAGSRCKPRQSGFRVYIPTATLCQCTSFQLKPILGEFSLLASQSILINNGGVQILICPLIPYYPFTYFPSLEDFIVFCSRWFWVHNQSCLDVLCAHPEQIFSTRAENPTRRRARNVGMGGGWFHCPSFSGQETRMPKVSVRGLFGTVRNCPASCTTFRCTYGCSCG